MDFLVQVKGFTNEAIFQDMFPIWTYARFPLLLLTGIFSEFEVVAGQGVLLVGAICGFATVLLTLFGTSFLPQQIAQITVAANFASRFAVNAVIFQLASPDHVQQDVHIMKAVLLLSNACSAILGEILRDSGAPLSMLYVISAVATGLALICSIFLLGSKPSARDSGPTGPTRQKVMASCSDLMKIFQLPCVAWWTIWALAVNPAHGVALTYWQNLLKDHVAESDHNGYMLGVSYLAAALLVAACRRSSILRSWTSCLVILSILSMGLLLLLLTISSTQVVFYLFLVAIQCIYEVSTSVSTFQVGCEVCTSVSSSNGPREPRLALLFCVTGVLSGAVASLVQHVRPISRRFLLVAVVLLLLAALLTVAALTRYLYLSWKRRGSRRRGTQDPFLAATDLMPSSVRS